MKTPENTFENAQQGPTPEQTMRRGDWLDVILCAWGEQPRTERIFVRQLPIARVEDGSFQTAIVSESLIVKLYTGMDDEWAEQLTEDSLVELLQLGKLLNFPTLERWTTRKAGNVHAILSLLKMTDDQIKKATAPLEHVLQNLQSRAASSSTRSAPKTSASPSSNSGLPPAAASKPNGSTASASTTTTPSSEPTAKKTTEQ